MSSPRLIAAVAALLPMLAAVPARGQERAYFVTYDHYLEEKGSLEIAANVATGPGSDGRGYAAPWLEVEYGVTGWWTTEFYLEGVTVRHDASAFTGWRFENRFRPLAGEHALNPVLYVEYEHINEASRIQKEIVGSGALSTDSIADLSDEHANELEAKLILSSAVRGWNLSENFVFEKNLSEDEGVEFGYAVGASRSLGGLATGASCHLCRENWAIGAELYGGLGSSTESGLGDTRHFVAPVVAWHVSPRSTLKASIGFGLTEASADYLVRVGWVFEAPVGRR